MVHDALNNFYLGLTDAYEEAVDADMPIDLLYGIVKAFEKQVTTDYERALLSQVEQEFMDEVQPGIGELH